VANWLEAPDAPGSWEARYVPITVEGAQGLSARHTVVLATTLEAVEVAADPQRLRQVLANLLANAVRYAPDGGSITVGLSILWGRSWAG
jgi:signal transduction histidine kinase